jgi:hypothetical protein
MLRAVIHVRVFLQNTDAVRSDSTTVNVHSLRRAFRKVYEFHGGELHGDWYPEILTRLLSRLCAETNANVFCVLFPVRQVSFCVRGTTRPVNWANT